MEGAGAGTFPGGGWARTCDRHGRRGFGTASGGWPWYSGARAGHPPSGDLPTQRLPWPRTVLCCTTFGIKALRRPGRSGPPFPCPTAGLTHTACASPPRPHGTAHGHRMPSSSQLTAKTLTEGRSPPVVPRRSPTFRRGSGTGTRAVLKREGKLGFLRTALTGTRPPPPRPRPSYLSRHSKCRTFRIFPPFQMSHVPNFPAIPNVARSEFSRRSKCRTFRIFPPFQMSHVPNFPAIPNVARSEFSRHSKCRTFRIFPPFQMSHVPNFPAVPNVARSEFSRHSKCRTFRIFPPFQMSHVPNFPAIPNVARSEFSRRSKCRTFRIFPPFQMSHVPNFPAVPNVARSEFSRRSKCRTFLIFPLPRNARDVTADVMQEPRQRVACRGQDLCAGLVVVRAKLPCLDLHEAAEPSARTPRALQTSGGSPGGRRSGVRPEQHSVLRAD